MRSENKLQVGVLRNGGTGFAGPAVIDLAYLLGENGGHLNVNGIAGLGAKSSFLLHVNYLLMEWARRMRRPGDPIRTQIVPIIFNVKNFDLFFMDRWNRNFNRDQHIGDWEAIGVSAPERFKNVAFYAPQQSVGVNPIRTGRDGVTAYSWGLADIIRQGLFRFLFADDDIGNANFGGLIAAVEWRLTDDKDTEPKLQPMRRTVR